MLNNRNIIVFSDDWGRYPSTLQHIGKVLSKCNRIIWVGSLGLRKPQFSITDLKRVVEKLKLMLFSQKKNLISEVIIVNPFIIPLHDIKVIRWINSFLLLFQLKRVLSKHNFTEPIVLTSSVIMDSIADKLSATSLHYFCLDDFTLFKGAFNCIQMLEKSILTRVDTCFAISETLKQSRVPAKGKSYFLPQGVEVEHFTLKSPKYVKDISRIPKPQIGFFGLIASWIDLKLVERCADAYPDFSFVFIGKHEVNIESLCAHKNIFLLGEIPYAELPKYAMEFDVGLIPFEINELTIAANPLKLLEYFALGVPVVATDLPEIRKFNDLVFIAKSKNEFIELIKVALDETSTESKRLKRKATAKKYSWGSIAETVSQIILKVDQNKKFLKK